MRIIVTAIVVIIFSLQASGQHKFNVLVGSGIGSYNHGDLRDWQNSIEGNWRNLGLETIDDFPSYVFYTGEISGEVVDRFSVGLVYRFESTGYKSSYADYSGHVQFQQELKMHGLGVVMRYDVLQQKKITVAAQLRTYYTKSTIDMQGELFLAPSNGYNESLKYKSNSWIVSPGVDVSYALADRISVHATIEYSVDFKGKLELESFNFYPYPTLYFIPPENTETDWSGIRLGLGVAYHF